MNRLSVSVCMASYNGIDYIKKQVQSILPQLCDDDELIVSDDGSIDGTWEYLLELQKCDERVKVVKGPGKGANCNFFALFELASNEIVFVSDQDDVWLPNKIDLVCECFKNKPETEVVLHKDIIKEIDTGKEYPCVSQRHGLIKNIVKNSYSGHRLAFRRDFRRLFLKNKEACPAYDQYIGLLAEKRKTGFFLNETLDYHLIHGNNISKPLTLLGKIIIRKKLICCLLSSQG